MESFFSSLKTDHARKMYRTRDDARFGELFWFVDRAAAGGPQTVADSCCGLP
jgi:hypothetical protein